MATRKTKPPKKEKPSLWENRIVGHGDAEIAKLEAHPLNPRNHGEFQTRSVKANLADLGWLKPIIVNKRTGRIIDGHLRVAIARDAGEKTVPVDYVDLPEELESQALLTLDPLAELAELEAALVAENLEAIHSDNADIQEFLANLAENCQIRPPDEDGFGKDGEAKEDFADVQVAVGPYRYTVARGTWDSWESHLRDKAGLVKEDIIKEISGRLGL